MCNMTMHIIKGVYTTSKKPKKKKKAEKVSYSAMELEWRKYNKEMRKTHCHNLQFETLDDYIQYRSGKNKKYKKEFQEYVPKKAYVRNEQEYASVETKTTDSPCSKPERQEYSGDYLVGIATMHKSNMVPVGKGDDPKNYSTMRRN